jgi:hypothetical protein
VQIQPTPKQPTATVPDLSTWRRSEKAIVRAQILPTATAPAPTAIVKVQNEAESTKTVSPTDKTTIAKRTSAKGTSANTAKVKAVVAKRTANP